MTRSRSWEPSEVEQTMIDGGHMVRRKITVAGQHLPCRELHVYRFTPAQDAPAAALVLVETDAKRLEGVPSRRRRAASVSRVPTPLLGVSSCQLYA